LVVYIIYVNYARSSKYQIMKYICWLTIYKKRFLESSERLVLYKERTVPKG